MERVPEARTEANERFVSCGIQCNVPKLSYFLEENPDGVNLTAATKEISARWKALSEEDCIAITTGSMQEIEEERENKVLALHNVPLQAFHDSRRTVQTVEKEVSRGIYC